MINEFINPKNMKKQFIEKLDQTLIMQKIEKALPQLTNVRNIRKYTEDVIADTLMNDLLDN